MIGHKNNECENDYGNVLRPALSTSVVSSSFKTRVHCIGGDITTALGDITICVVWEVS